MWSVSRFGSQQQSPTCKSQSRNLWYSDFHELQQSFTWSLLSKVDWLRRWMLEFPKTMFFSFVFLPETSLSNICIFYSIYVMCYGAVSQIVNLSKKCFYFSRTRRAEIHTTLKQSFLNYAKYLLLVEHILQLILYIFSCHVLLFIYFVVVVFESLSSLVWFTQ